MSSREGVSQGPEPLKANSQDHWVLAFVLSKGQKRPKEPLDNSNGHFFSNSATP